MFPEGWVTDVLSRNPALKALGNAVVPAQGAAALRMLAERVQTSALNAKRQPSASMVSSGSSRSSGSGR